MVLENVSALLSVKMRPLMDYVLQVMLYSAQLAEFVGTET